MCLNILITFSSIKYNLLVVGCLHSSIVSVVLKFAHRSFCRRTEKCFIEKPTLFIQITLGRINYLHNVSLERPFMPFLYNGNCRTLYLFTKYIHGNENLSGQQIVLLSQNGCICSNKKLPAIAAILTLKQYVHSESAHRCVQNETLLRKIYVETL